MVGANILNYVKRSFNHGGTALLWGSPAPMSDQNLFIFILVRNIQAIVPLPKYSQNPPTRQFPLCPKSTK